MASTNGPTYAEPLDRIMVSSGCLGGAWPQYERL
jgi:hypothetical protein